MINQVAPRNDLMPDITRPVRQDLAAAPPKAVDLEALLSLRLIRQHTKTDDVPHVTDDQLSLYRKAAFEAAEQYSGRLLTTLKTITESIAHPVMRRYRPTYQYTLQFPSADGLVYIYGSHQGQLDRTLQVAPGKRKISIPVLHMAPDASNCCNPNASGKELNWGLMIMYRAGISCVDDVPAGIISGALKFIAWMVSNPGDEIMTVRNRLARGDSGIVGTNNVALASGALEMWRQYNDEAV